MGTGSNDARLGYVRWYFHLWWRRRRCADHWWCGPCQVTLAKTPRGPYNLRNGYSSPTGSAGLGGHDGQLQLLSGTIGDGGRVDATPASEAARPPVGWGALTEDQINQILRFDPDLTSGSRRLQLLTDVPLACR